MRRPLARPGAVLLALTLAATAATADDDPYARKRANMVWQVQGASAGAPLVAERRVLDALGKVPRHRLVPEAVREQAYANRPLPIGYGQTISQPYIVALMTELLQPEPGHRVFELGTGSGYQAAVLAELVDQVYSMEIVVPLAQRAAADLAALGYANVHVRHGDGYYGWPEQGPFDGIVVTAAATSIPPPLLEQLKPGGRMVIPVGAAFATQTLLLIEKRADGSLRTKRILPVRFVPLTGERPAKP